jgi:hypothetical protein
MYAAVLMLAACAGCSTRARRCPARPPRCSPLWRLSPLRPPYHRLTPPCAGCSTRARPWPSRRSPWAPSSSRCDPPLPPSHTHPEGTPTPCPRPESMGAKWGAPRAPPRRSASLLSLAAAEEEVQGLVACGVRGPVGRVCGRGTRPARTRPVCGPPTTTLPTPPPAQVNIKEDGNGAGGYAKEMSKEFIDAEVRVCVCVVGVRRGYGLLGRRVPLCGRPPLSPAHTHQPTAWTFPPAQPLPRCTHGLPPQVLEFTHISSIWRCSPRSPHRCTAPHHTPTYPQACKRARPPPLPPSR